MKGMEGCSDEKGEVGAGRGVRGPQSCSAL